MLTTQETITTTPHPVLTQQDRFSLTARKIYRTGLAYLKMSERISARGRHSDEDVAASLRRCSDDMFFIFSRMVAGMDPTLVEKIKQRRSK